MVTRSNGTRTNDHRTNGHRADVVAPGEGTRGSRGRKQEARRRDQVQRALGAWKEEPET